jgi:predicted PurR-regulated permease PerM
MFILLEYRYFKDKLNLMVGNHSRGKEIFDMIDRIKGDIKSYFVIKTIVSFVT